MEPGLQELSSPTLLLLEAQRAAWQVPCTGPGFLLWGSCPAGSDRLGDFLSTPAGISPAVSLCPQPVWGGDRALGSLRQEPE